MSKKSTPKTTSKTQAKAEAAPEFWLFKSEPDVFSFEDLKGEPQKTDHWDGVRNYQARNFMRDQMKKGQLGFFYHSNCEVPGIVGVVKIVKEAYPDFTSWDPDSKYFDPKSSPETPRWFMVDVKWHKAFKRTVSLKEMKEDPTLDGFFVTQRGARLSVGPVGREHFEHILQLGGLESLGL